MNAAYTTKQEEYRQLWLKLCRMQRYGRDREGDVVADAVRARMFELWLAMTDEERGKFMAPMTLTRTRSREHREKWQGRRKSSEFHRLKRARRIAAGSDGDPSQADAVRIRENAP